MITQHWIEPAAHLEIVIRWADRYIELRPEVWVVVHLQQKYLKEIPDRLRKTPQFQWVSPARGQSWSCYFAGWVEELTAAERVILITTAGRYDYFKRVRKPLRLTVVAHNLHWLLAVRRFREPGLRHLARRLKQWRRNGNRIKLLARAAALAVPTQQMADYACNELKHEGKTEVLPFAFAPADTAPPPLPPPGEELCIAIPGTVRERGRDWVMGQAKLLELATRYRCRIELVGRLAEPKIADRLRAAGLEVITHSQTLSEDEYQSALERAHMIWVPLPEYVSVAGYREKMGYSKVSGGWFDAVAAGKKPGGGVGLVL